ACSGDVLVFASELKSVLASGLVAPRVDVAAVDAYLSLGFVPGPRTILEGVCKLAPGSVLVADEKGVRTERYWEYPHPAPESSRRPVGDWREELLDRLSEA